MSETPRYSIIIEWSDEDGVFVVSLPEWGDLVHTHGATYDEALRNGRDLLGGLVAARQQAGKPLPRPRVVAGGEGMGVDQDDPLDISRS